jgi:hypothetical protein
MSVQEIPEHIAQQVDKLRNQNKDYELRLKAANPVDPLLMEIIESLALADLASHPAKSNPIDNQKVSGTITQPEPGQNVRGAIRARHILRSNLESAIRRFHVAAQNDWRPPVADQPELRRCRNRKCVAVDIRIPRYVGSRRSRIELVNCPKCDHKLGDV